MVSHRKLRMGMVGGGRDAFIGAVHRWAAALDGDVVFVAGALSSTPERARASGADLGLDDDRNYPTWVAMVDGERDRAPGDCIDFVTIVTPNDRHHDIARAFIEAGIPVVCDKPLTSSLSDAHDLLALARGRDALFAVTYNYSGYPLVKEARRRVLAGELGEIRKVIVEYHQGWLATPLEREGQKQASWRTDPDRSGGGAIGDIGSHAEHLLRYVTGLQLESLCADLTTFVEGRRVDDDGQILLRFTSGARGVLTVSQVCVGRENDLRLRVWGTRGSLEWQQEEPNRLLWSSAEGPDQVLRRGHDSFGEEARRATRVPPGHPEGFIEAFANLYDGVKRAIRAGGGADAGAKFDFPDVGDGARGVHFIDRARASARGGALWVDARWVDARRVDASGEEPS
ncbi:MAG: Gfo/Idh/MocA family oxidoreductase [Planctomycetes bacterium]|nr:Gfo/Idh/MocA family oxidoreductase [Planctomycetota bacterium]